MFGRAYFGARYFGPAYWGEGGSAVEVPAFTLQIQGWNLIMEDGALV